MVPFHICMVISSLTHAYTNKWHHLHGLPKSLAAEIHYSYTTTVRWQKCVRNMYTCCQSSLKRTLQGPGYEI